MADDQEQSNHFSATVWTLKFSTAGPDTFEDNYDTMVVAATNAQHARNTIKGMVRKNKVSQLFAERGTAPSLAELKDAKELWGLELDAESNHTHVVKYTSDDKYTALDNLVHNAYLCKLSSRVFVV